MNKGRGPRTSQCLSRTLPDFSLLIRAEIRLPFSKKGKAYRQPESPYKLKKAASASPCTRVQMVRARPHNTGPYSSLECIYNEASTALGTTLLYQLSHYVHPFCPRWLLWTPNQSPALVHNTLRSRILIRSEDITPFWLLCLPSLACGKNGNSSKCRQRKGERKENKRETGRETTDHLGQNMQPIHRILEDSLLWGIYPYSHITDKENETER